MNCLTASASRDNILFIRQRGRGKNNGNDHFQKSPTLTANSWQTNHSVCGFRRLSQTEAERLQTLPDGYTASMSYSAAIEALGNGWTVDVIAWILSHWKK
jgi:site-specific DNA-cytosine methylase